MFTQRVKAPVTGITSEALANSIREQDTKTCRFPLDAGCDRVSAAGEARPGDAILTIGAGNVSRASGELMVLLGTELR